MALDMQLFANFISYLGGGGGVGGDLKLPLAFKVNESNNTYGHLKITPMHGTNVCNSHPNDRNFAHAKNISFQFSLVQFSLLFSHN